MSRDQNRAGRPSLRPILSALTGVALLALVSGCGGGDDEVREAFLAKARASNPSEQNVRVAACLYDEYVKDYGADDVAILDRAVGEGWLSSPEPPPGISSDDAIKLAVIRNALLTCTRDN